MSLEPIVQFSVTVTSTENASWQGVVECGGKRYAFRSELQLLRWLAEQHPALRPQVSWSEAQSK